MKRIFLLLLAATGLQFALGQTTINSNITANTTWDLAGSPYILTNDIRVDSGVTLTIDPGVRIHFEVFVKMDLHGNLSALGTPTDSIFFTGTINNISNTNHINYRNNVDLDYVDIRFFQESFSTDPIVQGNPNAAPSFKASHCSWILNTQCLVSLGTNLSEAAISHSYMEENNFGVIGDQVEVTHSTFVNNLRGVSGSDIEVDSCTFLDNIAGIYVYLPFSAKNSYFHNNQSGATLILSTFGTPNTVSYLEGNEFDENPNSLFIYRDTGMVAASHLVIQDNIICSSGTNLLYRVLPGTSTSFPLLELANNCWCEWDSADVVAGFDNQSNQPVNIMPMDSTCLPSLVFPGDANHDQITNNLDLLPLGLHFGETGPSRPNASLNWSGQRCQDWTNTQANGRNVKHADTDGSGIIDADDTLAIYQNYGLTHNSWRLAAPTSGLNLDFVMPQGPILPGDSLSIPIQVSNLDSQATNLYGLAFSVKYSTRQLDSAGVKVDFNNSILGNKNVDMLTLDKDFYAVGQTDIALTRTDGASISSHGMVCSLIIVISEDLAKKSEPLTLTFDAPYAIDGEGNAIPLNPGTANASIDIGTQVLPKEAISNLRIYPQPASQHLNIEAEGSHINKITVYSLEGKSLFEERFLGQERVKLNLPSLQPSLYILEIQTEEGSFRKKILLD